MSSISSHRPNQTPVLLLVMLLLTLLWMTSCDISKKAVKSKTNTTTNKEGITHTGQSNYDFGTIDKDEYSLNYEPLDYTKLMWVITPHGDTVQSQNAKVTASKSNTKTQNKKVDNTISSSKIEETQRNNTIDKEKEKTEKFNSEIILYLVIGVVVLGLFFQFLMYRSINRNTAILNTVLQNK